MPRAAGNHLVTWRLSFHGETHDLNGEMKVVARDGSSLLVSGSETFDVRDWGLTPGGYLGIKIRPEATFAVDLVAARDQPREASVGSLDAV